MKERHDYRCIKGDATQSKTSKKSDYFSNKISDYLSQNNFL